MKNMYKDKTKKNQIVKTKKSNTRYAVQHDMGMLVRGISDLGWTNFAGEFSKAMTFPTKKDAEGMAKFFNRETKKNGGTGKAYSVIEKSKYKKPDFLKKKKK